VSGAGGSELLFVPLGGSDEIGMNLNLYGFGPPGREQWIMVDLGITFADGRAPGADVVTADPSFIEERRDDLLGLIVTHAHEDHLGAMPYLWQRLRCPVYATPFAAAVLGNKLEDAAADWSQALNTVALGERLTLGPFTVDLVGLTHSIPEPNGLAIRTPLGTVFHTGDWKFDPDPVVGAETDHAALAALGDEGVLAMVGDSTNVFTEGTSGSEGAIAENLHRLIEDAEQRVVVSCFASNIARIETIARVAERTGRSIVLAGRSLKRMTAAARATGYMDSRTPFLMEEDARNLPPENTLIIATGSQGEPRAALARMASGDHPRLTLSAGDTVVFSSRIIPGNETEVGRMHNDLVRAGVRVLTWRDADIHVSGHPARDELAHMYATLRPRIAVPVHGEARHLAEHAALARACQVPEAVTPTNGAMIRLAPGPAEIVGHVPSGYLYQEGNRLVPAAGALVRSRMKALHNGVAVLTVLVDDDGALADDIQMFTSGLLEADENSVEDAVADAVEASLDRLPRREIDDDNAIAERLRIAARRAFQDEVGKRPVVAIHLVRVE
jgi:ribonuclease J